MPNSKPIHPSKKKKKTPNPSQNPTKVSNRTSSRSLWRPRRRGALTQAIGPRPLTSLSPLRHSRLAYGTPSSPTSLHYRTPSSSPPPPISSAASWRFADAAAAAAALLSHSPSTMTPQAPPGENLYSNQCCACDSHAAQAFAGVVLCFVLSLTADRTK